MFSLTTSLLGVRFKRVVFVGITSMKETFLKLYFSGTDIFVGILSMKETFEIVFLRGWKARLAYEADLSPINSYQAGRTAN